jgi:hypothetical protein
VSIRWIRNVIIDGNKTTLEIQLGDKKIGDKCYTRTGTDMEEYFFNNGGTRDEIVAQGRDILKKRCKAMKITYPDGREYDWQ